MRDRIWQHHRVLIAFVIVLLNHPVQSQTATDLQNQVAADERAKQLHEVETQRTLSAIDGLIARGNEAATLLGRLQSKADTFFPRLEALLVNDDGKRLGSDNAAFLHFMDLQNEPTYRSDIIRSKTAAMVGLVATLEKVRAAPPVGFVPPESSKTDIDDDYSWAKNGLAHLTEESDWIDATIASAPKDLDLSKQNTLKARITDYKIQQIRIVSESKLNGRLSATRETERIISDAARIAELEKANEEGAILLRQEREEVERLKIEQDMELKRMQDQEAQRVADLNQQLAASDAARAKQVAVTSAIADAGKIEAEKVRLKQKCQDPHVQELLSPFVSAGYWQPSGGFSIDRQPLSFSKLRQSKALDRDEKGLLALVEVAENRADRERPRWSMPPNPRRMTKEELEQAKETQDDLNELGPTMVELGMLSP